MTTLVHDKSTKPRRQRLAHVTWLAASVSCVSVMANAQAQSRGERALEEVIVTAQKRVERLQDVPVPVTSISTESLATNNQVLLRDFYATVPGLNVVPSIQSNQSLSIRGITTGIGNPTVGVTIDDVPYGGSTNNSGGRVIPDFDPGDLARIEVLRGPQGTLYGASSMGGLLKFVTRDPSTDAFSGSVQAGTSSVENGDDIGYSVRGSVNIPLTDTFAMRASAFTRSDAGYIDNVQTGEEGVNRADAVGGRVSTLWRPTDDLSVKLAALYQEIEGDGATSVDPVLGDLRQSRLVDTGWYEREAQAYSANVVFNLGSAELTSITGYNINSFSDAHDFGYAQGAAAQSTFGVSGVSLITAIRTEKLSQEVRVAIPLGDHWDWLIGAFYTEEDSELDDTRLAVAPATGAIAGRLSRSDFDITHEEYAAFTNLTYRVTERFDIQVGLRQSEIKPTLALTSINAQGVARIDPKRKADDSALTYLVTPRFKPSEDVMVYARLASGYRSGGLNTFPGPGVPFQYDPDETQNYELGLKGDFVGGALSIDASVYYIDWKDLQILLVSPANFSFFTNGSRARSQGVELSVDAALQPNLRMSGWVSWNDVELTEPLPPGGAATAFGADGARLPNSSRWSGSLALDHEFELGSTMTAFIGATGTYVGDRIGPFRNVALRQDFPEYTKVDMRLGARWETWTATLYANNVADKRGVIYGGLGALPPTAFAYIQPRTIGLSLTKTF